MGRTGDLTELFRMKLRHMFIVARGVPQVSIEIFVII